MFFPTIHTSDLKAGVLWECLKTQNPHCCIFPGHASHIHSMKGVSDDEGVKGGFRFKTYVFQGQKPGWMQFTTHEFCVGIAIYTRVGSSGRVAADYNPFTDKAKEVSTRFHVDIPGENLRSLVKREIMKPKEGGEAVHADVHGKETSTLLKETEELLSPRSRAAEHTENNKRQKV